VEPPFSASAEGAGALLPPASSVIPKSAAVSVFFSLSGTLKPSCIRITTWPLPATFTVDPGLDLICEDTQRKGDTGT
jgi:hypothetical protein